MCSYATKVLVFVLFVICSSIVLSKEDTDDFYKLLEVPRDASVKEIRKAFKNLAVKFHPDKNKDDKDADAKFVKLAKAYEILKDPETRKRYDLYGDTGDKSNGKQYHSYSYYQNDFGIYDDDPLIVTLGKADFEASIVDTTQAWFVNFYSPQCGHCHELAPVWRKLSREMEGVVRVASVNCEDEWALCNQLRIMRYPTLLFYEKGSHMHDGEHYDGEKSLMDLQEFIISKITTNIQTIDNEVWDYGFHNQPWLLFLCPPGSLNCPEPDTRLKIAATIEELMQTGIVTDPDLCDKIYPSHKESPVVYRKAYEEPEGEAEAKEKNLKENVYPVDGADAKEIVDKILDLLPDPQTLDEAAFKSVRSELRQGSDKAWLICFYMGHATELNIQLKRLPTLVSYVNIGLVHCGKSSALCSSLHVSHYPAWGVLKEGGAFELHNGREGLNDIAAFARDSIKSTNLHALSPADFYKIKNEGEVWFIDWYAPWCPPCKKLMPEVRRASQHFQPDKIQFGTVDCTQHVQLCTSVGIQSYPTTALYNGSNVNYFHGIPNEESIVEFVENIVNPLVITLDESSFAQLLIKPKEELWVVDYYASWCGECQMLAPHWRTLAKQVKDLKNVKVAQVDCVKDAELCQAQSIRSYPTIRLYPLGSRGLNTMSMYKGPFEAGALKRWIVGFLPSPVVTLNAAEFRKQILTKKYILPWLVDFYAPWCAFCTHFEPEFISIAQKLEGKVRTGKIDCEAERHFCAELRIGSYPTVKLFLSPEENYHIQSYEKSGILQIVNQLIEQRKTQTHDEL